MDLEDVITMVLTGLVIAGVTLAILFGGFKIATKVCGCVPERMEEARKQEAEVKLHEDQMKERQKAGKK